MKCPKCGYSKTKVTDSRREGDSIRRKRECINCNYKFKTYEKVVEELPLVIKKDGRREPFSKEKLLNGLKLAVTKRPLPLKTIEELVDQIEQDLNLLSNKEISSEQLGKMVLSRLKEIDEIAYIRFASVYYYFKDAKEFLSYLKEMIEEPKEK